MPGAHVIAVRVSQARGFAIAVLVVAIATAIKLAFSESLGRGAPFALFGLAIIAAGALGGSPAAVFSSLLSTLAAWTLFLAPYNSFALADSTALIQVLVLLLEGLGISAIVSRIHATQGASEQSARRVERLQSLTAALAAAATPRDVAAVTVSKGVEALGATTGVFVQPIRNAELEVIAHHGIPSSVLALLSVFPQDADYPTAVVFRQRRPEWVEDSADYARRYPELSSRFDGGVAAAATLPLRVGDRVLGAIAFQFDHARKYSQDERDLMETLASQAAQAFERAQLFEEEVRSRSRLEKLYGLMQALSTALTRSEVAEIIVDNGMKIAAADTCTLYVPDGAGALRLIGDRGVSVTVLDRIRCLTAESDNPSFVSIRTGETIWAETEEAYIALYPALATLKTEGPRARAFWSVPLVAEGEPVGLLGMGFYAPRQFPPEERAFVEMLSRHCAQALRRAERLEAERAARLDAERLWSSFETTVRSIGDAVIATDKHGRVTLMNPIAEQLTGWRESDAKTQPLKEVFRIVHEQTRGEVENPVARVIREGVVVGLANHTVLLHRDGRQETPIDDSGAPIRGPAGELDGVVLVFRDVSAKKRHETLDTFLSEATAALAESLDYRATLARVAQLVVPRLADWCAVDIVREDAAVERLAVAHVDPSKIELAHELQRKYPPDPNALAGRSNVLRTGRSELFAKISDELLQRSAIDAEHLRVSRELCLRSAMIVPLVARGRVLGAMTFVWAESGKEYGADDLAFAEDFCHRCAVAVDNALLYGREQRAREAADLANRSKDDFLAIMGHELRNPLAPMVTAVHLMKSRDIQAHKEIAVLDRQLRHMMRLLEDLLDLSRVLRDKLELSRQVVELAEVVASAVEVASPLIESKRHRLAVDVPNSGFSVDVDPVRMAQVLGNLLTNAAKYTDLGGDISVRASASDGAVIVAIEDSGVGIEPDLMPRLFELFSQGKQSIDRQMGGLGIGLAIASRLVKAHGGELAAHSDGLNRGSRFSVRLPLAVLQTPAVALSPALSEPKLSRKRVLLVDDNEDSGELLALLVEQFGHETRVALEGVSALALAREFQPHAVFLDIGLPGMNGFEVARQLRLMPACATIPIIAVTGYTRDSDRAQALSAGFSDHIAKPIAPELLQRMLELLE